jgi:hypothetical protein
MGDPQWGIEAKISVVVPLPSIRAQKKQAVLSMVVDIMTAAHKEL